MVWPAIITGAAGLIGGILSNKSNKQANQANLGWSQEQWEDQKLFRQEDIAMQKEFAQNSAGWQMKDLFKTADESGIHRLAALGGPAAAQYSAPSMGTTSAGQVGSDFGFLGDSVSSAIGQFMKTQQVKQNTEKHKAEVNLLNQEAELLKAQSRTISAAVLRAGRDGGSDIGSSSQDGPPPKTLENTPLKEEVRGDSGLTMANPDNPPEFEGDVWTWARKGTLVKNLAEVYQRNTMSQAQRDRVKRLTKNISDLAKGKKSKSATPEASKKISELRYEVWKAQRNQPNSLRRAN